MHFNMPISYLSNTKKLILENNLFYHRFLSRFNFNYVNVRIRFVADHNSVGFAREKALTISFVERGFERLGLDRQAMGFFRGVHTRLSDRHPWSLSLGGGLRGSRFWPFFPAPSLGYLFFLLYSPVSIILHPRIGSIFPRLILVPSVHTQSRWGWL